MKFLLGIVAIVFWLNALDVAHAKSIDLGVKSPDYMKATCAKVRGIFVDNEGKMSCVFPNGVVRCTEANHCYGYPKHPRPSVQPGNPGGVIPQPSYPQYPEWQWHGNNYRW